MYVTLATATRDLHVLDVISAMLNMCFSCFFSFLFLMSCATPHWHLIGSVRGNIVIARLAKGELWEKKTYCERDHVGH